MDADFTSKKGQIQMRIIIDDYGSYIHKKGNRFIISKKSHQREFSADKVSQILIYKGAAISAAAVALAVENGIDIVFFENKRHFVI